MAIYGPGCLLVDPLWFSFRLSNVAWRLVTAIVYRPCFGHIGKGSIIRKPLLIRNAKAIFIGDRCSIRDHGRIEVISSPNTHDVRLEIGDGSTMEQGAHIVCQHRVTIGRNVTIGPRCLIMDTLHPHEDIDTSGSIGARIGPPTNFVEICEQAFLGVGVAVMPNVRIGKHCIIGANSVVTKSLPDYSICVGSPARVVKRYDHEAKAWVNEAT